ncbi:MAG: histidine phosphatase family protein [Tissierellia bacterium]|nr:histidine phosphatase family protein [Tissierellia bacterium]
MNLYLLRHGESEDNVKRIFSRPSCSLTEKGKKEILSIGEVLKEIDFEGIFISPYQRTLESAQLLPNNLGKKKEILEEIHEISFGTFSGLSYKEILEKYPKEGKTWFEDPFKNSPPDGESIEDAFQRISTLVDNWKMLKGNYLAITHDGVIRLIICSILEDLHQYFKFHIGNGSLTLCHLEKDFSYISQLSYKKVTTI